MVKPEPTDTSVSKAASLVPFAQILGFAPSLDWKGVSFRELSKGSPLPQCLGSQSHRREKGKEYTRELNLQKQLLPSRMP